MPWGGWINELPTAFFNVVHIAAFAPGAGFAWLAFRREQNDAARLKNSGLDDTKEVCRSKCTRR